jgi:ribonuclease HI
MMKTEKQDAKRWIFAMIKSLKHEDLIRCLVTLWAVWSARRKAIHEEVFQSSLFTHSFVESFLRDLECASASKVKAQPATQRMQVRRWIASPPGVAKINVDAAVKKSEKAGAIAAVCRSSEGVYLGASAVQVPCMDDPTILEALACQEALALAADLHLSRVKVASDCLEVINSLDGNYLGKFSSVLCEIRSRSRDFADVTFVHERRTANMEAHSLARSCISFYRSPHLAN